MDAHPLVFIACYTDFDVLAHKPTGTRAKFGIYIYRLDPKLGQLVLLSVCEDVGHNPAFLRFHPKRNILYACTESIERNDEVVVLSVSPTTGQLKKLSAHSAEGRSTCFLTIDRQMRRLLAVNYWDSTISTLPMDDEGFLDDAHFVHRSPLPQEGEEGKVKKAEDRADHLANRQSETHPHSLVLDPVCGAIAYVPDLGQDHIKQFLYDFESGSLTLAGAIPAGRGQHDGKGPRYMEFHKEINVAYVVNEISSTVTVFEFDQGAAAHLRLHPDTARETLRQIQEIETIPVGFPKKLNTCGRITVDPSGNFVVVSNRGHDSITVFRVRKSDGTLSVVNHFHTRGKTPRHFQFDPSGRWLLVANQDTDNVAVFAFNPEEGTLTFTNNVYDVPSPNFVCCQGVRAYASCPL